MSTALNRAELAQQLIALEQQGAALNDDIRQIDVWHREKVRRKKAELAKVAQTIIEVRVAIEEAKKREKQERIEEEERKRRAVVFGSGYDPDSGIDLLKALHKIIKNGAHNKTISICDEDWVLVNSAKAFLQKQQAEAPEL